MESPPAQKALHTYTDMHHKQTANLKERLEKHLNDAQLVARVEQELEGLPVVHSTRVANAIASKQGNPKPKPKAKPMATPALAATPAAAPTTVAVPAQAPAVAQVLAPISIGAPAPRIEAVGALHHL